MSHCQADPVSGAASSASPGYAALAGAHVLVAEDNEVNLEVAKFHLENLGCKTTWAVNGAAALDCASRSAFDFVLMDCQMPVMDGFEALEAIRELDARLERQPTPIIAVTAADDPESKRRCDSAGFDGFLAKPYSAAQLISALSRCRSDGSAIALAVANSTTPNPYRSLDLALFRGFVSEFGVEAAETLLKPFVALLQETDERLDRAQATNNLTALQALSHKIAGASGTVGAAALSQQARKIEGLCKRRSNVAAADIANLKALVGDAATDFGKLVRPRAIAELVNGSGA